MGYYSIPVVYAEIAGYGIGFNPTKHSLDPGFKSQPGSFLEGVLPKSVI